MNRLYALLAAALMVMPAIASAQTVQDSFRVFTVLAPPDLVRVDTTTGNYLWSTNPPPGGIQANLVLTDDGFGDNHGCAPIANTTEVAGNIAVMSRGPVPPGTACGFSLKAYHAQQAGAVAFVVYNHDAGAESDSTFSLMAGVDSAAAVTIPGVFWARYIRNALLPALQAGTTVTARIDPYPVVAIEPNGPLEGAYEVFAARPNPFSASTEFGVRLAQTQDVRVEVFDALGRRVALLHDGALPAGNVHEFSLHASALPSGVYMYRVTGADFVETRNVILAR